MQEGHAEGVINREGLEARLRDEGMPETWYDPTGLAIDSCARTSVWLPGASIAVTSRGPK
jgi:hypothetical protein